MGFAEGWIRKVMMCVETVSYKVKINGKISETINPGRGLRQGDPISPYLFLLCAEWLNYALRKYQEGGLIEGIKICRNAPVITHLMFADDCVLFLKARSDSVDRISEILRRYEEISGQKVNYAKSEMVCSKNVPEELKLRFKDELQFKMVESHSSYLGLPLIFSNKKTILFRQIEERVMRKIGDWKHKLLSGAGREVLIKSVLQSVPVYAMSCFKIPLSLCGRIAGDFLRFWWNGSKCKGIHWLRAEELCKEKGSGGLGFRKLELMNLALLAKQGWRLLMEPELLVSKLFKAKYYPNSDLFNAAGGSRPSFAWRGILEALYIIKRGVEWDETERKYLWKRGGSATFTVKEGYYIACELERLKKESRGEQSDAKETRNFWRNYWKLKIPNKIKIFGWRLYHDCLPTMQNLVRRGCQVQNKCGHCGARKEDAIHIFRDCWWIKGLLQGSGLPPEVWNNVCGDPGYWLWLCAKVCREEEFRILLCGLWLGWKDRNEIVHGKEGSRIESLQVKLKCMIREFDKGASEACWWDAQVRSAEDELGIFCDGSFDPETKSGGAAAVLLSRSSIDGVRANYLENCNSVLDAELRAIEIGAKMAMELKLPKVKIFSDSREALWAINMGSWRPGTQLSMIKECIRLLDEQPGWVLGGISREANAVADSFAKKARIDKWSWSSLGAVPRIATGIM
ncbi:unnamed protein product [Rhodiola kirilowii]